MEKISISLYDILVCLSHAQELVSTKLFNHHQQVAYLAFRLSEQMKLPMAQQKEIFLASLVHDIGALSAKERIELIEAEPMNPNNHAFRGANLLEGFKPLQTAAGMIRFHHLPWDNGKGLTYLGKEVPLESHIIHLADRTCAMLRSNQNILTQIPDILSKVGGQANTTFQPEMVEALAQLSTKEYIWLDLISRAPITKITDAGLVHFVHLEMDDLMDLALVFSRIIDFRSRFTACHSAGVAKAAEALARRVGLSPDECSMMLIAGYLHDLGKIAISDEVLEKPGKLNEEEFHEMRAHTYYTYSLLQPLTQLKQVNTWASFHHERPDGTGYPFHIGGDSLSLGARIMAVADVFTAITEDRPYRKGMEFEHAVTVLNDMVADHALDGKVVNILLEHFEEINTVRDRAQREAAKQYEEFLRMEREEPTGWLHRKQRERKDQST